MLYLIDSRGRDTGALTALDLQDRQGDGHRRRHGADVGGVMVHPTENTIQAVSFTYERTAGSSSTRRSRPTSSICKTVADGDITVASRTLDDKPWIVAFLMDDGPVRYYVYDRPTKKARFLFTNRKDLEGLPLDKMHPVVIKARDGLDLVSYLTLPPGSDRSASGRPDAAAAAGAGCARRPVGTRRLGLQPEHQLLANRGYAVLAVNYRGSTGFGKKFLNAGNREWAGKMHDDLLDAVDWAIQEKIADPDKVAIMGGSYGGYATLVGLTLTPDKFACGVDIVGPSNLLTLLSIDSALLGAG